MKYKVKHLLEDITNILNGLIRSGFTSKNSLEDYFWNDIESNLFFIPKERREQFKQVFYDKNKTKFISSLIENLAVELLQEKI